MKKIELKIKLLISGLLLLTALLITVLIFYTPGKGKNETSPALPSGLTEKNIPQLEDDIIKQADEERLAISTLPQVPDKAIPAYTVKKKEKKLYFIIDDAGYSTEKLAPFLDFPGKLTVAVLPGLQHSRDSAEMALSKGKKVILHQPMEAVNGNNTGPYAIRKSMQEKEIIEILEKNINSLPSLSGVNNHMGSAITSDIRIMEIILRFLGKHGLIFIDSLTTSDSICLEASENTGLAIAQRDIFLDNVDNREAIMESINQGRQTAENKGYAVMIGHVWSSELADTMMQIYPNLIEEGFTLKDASEFLMGDE